MALYKYTLAYKPLVFPFAIHFPQLFPHSSQYTEITLLIKGRTAGFWRELLSGFAVEFSILMVLKEFSC